MHVDASLGVFVVPGVRDPEKNCKSFSKILFELNLDNTGDVIG